jgi:tetrahydromethanopterin S-methyltransferase subunit A
MNALGEVIGELCKVILPINEEYYLGIAGRLLSENKGIDSIIKYVNKTPQVNTIIVCGREVWGHKSGHSLFELHKHGIDENNRIINSKSPDPYLTVTKSKINYFQKNVNLVNLINETSFELILKKSKII